MIALPIEYKIGLALVAAVILVLAVEFLVALGRRSR